MATPERAEARAGAGHGRDHVSMGELLASCAAARALSTPPRRPGPEQGEEAVAETVGTRRDEAA
ncbi:hypothetical protein [Streptomyces gardneri]|uniref:Uncharacterized protein n=1 Tax=Streptomyces gardneri TaxID=66892 RepID=A0A4Y3RIF9_9ACTN|nr:hypothetical protein [Streptomyces gardneri]GEB56483.1 hypothetical protein SGA01_20880 [Streptomyces gardneri]GHH11665.1 hypothetical protein GCM10017674_57270 [Streptomyces gardneri]